MSCCVKYFGLFPHNKAIVLDNFFAEFTGKYIVLVDLPNGNKKSIELDVEAGDEFTIPQGELNESALIKFQILDPWGKPVKFVDDYEPLNCENLQLQTYINQSLKCDDNNCDNNSEDNSSGPYGYY
jgi:hypothetical protein